MRGKWAQGIVPRHFHWVIKERFAVCERPGGYGDTHRRVRRQEEIIWIRQQGFDRIVSLLPSTHNLHNYDELGVAFHHVPFPGTGAGPEALLEVLVALRDLLGRGERIVVHHDEVGDAVAGIVASHLVWSGLVPHPPHAISAAEQLLERELGPGARLLVTHLERLPTSAEVPTVAGAAERPDGGAGSDLAPGSASTPDEVGGTR